jgi:asparagine synthase (glutamine-hydrolysing)
MCGIAGFLGGPMDSAEAVGCRMTDAIEHRGPDDAGLWIDRDAGVVLGHRRLSIVDLSPAGHQPMHSRNQRYVIVFNGEIYNHAVMRAELDSAARIEWRGHSDTETLLAGIEHWGIMATLKRCVGMFAFAVWDRAERTLTLARDRAGEKPLYFGWQRGTLLFGSELKALRAHPGFEGRVDRGSIALLMRHNYIPEPRCIYEGIHKVPPGTFIVIRPDGSDVEPIAYWSAREIALAGQEKPFVGSDKDALGELERVLGDAIADQMVADVPLGAFLSGGVDSSTVVALMQERSNRPVRTFTIGFHEAAYNEAGHARAVARHLGTEHTELLVTPEEARAVIPQLATIYDEPFADSSQIPTFLVSQLARRHVKVSLSGDAGDELFGGYNRYSWATRLWNTVAPYPTFMRRAAAGAMRSFSPTTWQGIFDSLRCVLPPRLRVSQAGNKIHRAAELLAIESPAEIYMALVSHWMSPGTLVRDAIEPRSELAELMVRPLGHGFDADMMFWDFLTYLPGDILTKVDRAAMAVSLETRVPLLDHRVVEFAWSLPLHLRVRQGQGKWLLRELLFRRVPRDLIDRPKMGFGVPIDSWLRGPLREWAESLLDASRLEREGFFMPAPIRQKWLEHLAGTHNWAYHLWDVLMFQAWHEEIG